MTLPTIIAGKTYKVLGNLVVPFDYTSGGRPRARGKTFVADAGDANNDFMRIGLTRGHIVLVSDTDPAVDTTGATFNTVNADFDALIAANHTFTEQHSQGNVVRAEQVGDAALLAEEYAELKAEALPSITAGLTNASTVLSGKCYGPVGTTVTVFVGGVSKGSAITNGTFDWSVTGISPALATGNSVYVTASLEGSVTGVTITAGGTLYTGVATATFSAAPANGSTATGHVVSAAGVVTSVIIDNPGAGYVALPTVTIGNGGGTGSGATATSVVTYAATAASTAVTV